MQIDCCLDRAIALQSTRLVSRFTDADDIGLCRRLPRQIHRDVKRAVRILTIGASDARGRVRAAATAGDVAAGQVAVAIKIDGAGEIFSVPAYQHAVIAGQASAASACGSVAEHRYQQ